MLEIVFELRNMEKTWGKKIVVTKMKLSTALHQPLQPKQTTCSRV